MSVAASAARRSRTSTSSRPRRSTSCARSPPSESGPVLLFSGGKDSIVLLRLAEKAFRPGKFPFPVMHVDTGHNFPEVIEYRDRRVAELGERLVVASVQDSIDRGRVVEQTGPRAIAQPAADDDAARRDRGARLRRGDGRRAPRRGARPREGAHLQLPRRLRPVEPARAAARAVEPLQRRASARASTSACSRSRTGRSSTCGSTSRASSSSCRRSTSPTSARCSAATGCSTPPPTYVERLPDEEPFTRDRPLPHRRRHDLHRRRRVARGDDRRGRRPRSPRRTSPSAARPAPTTASPKRRWRTASALATSESDRCSGRAAAARHRGLGRRRQVDADRPAALRHEADPRRPARAHRGDLASAAATATSTSRSSPTACAPSASRGSRSTSPTARSSPRGAASSSPTRPGTCSTRATWSPAPRPRTSR